MVVASVVIGFEPGVFGWQARLLPLGHSGGVAYIGCAVMGGPNGNNNVSPLPFGPLITAYLYTYNHIKEIKLSLAWFSVQQPLYSGTVLPADKLLG